MERVWDLEQTDLGLSPDLLVFSLRDSGQDR